LRLCNLALSPERVWNWHRFNQPLGVLNLRVAQNLIHLALLNDFTQAHDGDSIAQQINNR